MSEHTIWRIDETSEWTHDDALAEGALEAGLGAYEFTVDDLAKAIERLETKITNHEKLFQDLYKQIHERIIDGVDAVPQVKNSYFSLIEHDFKEYQRKIALI
jgi:hypothetical protein